MWKLVARWNGNAIYGRWLSLGSGGRWGRFFGPGEIRLALLSMLEHAAKHGYELMEELETKSGGIYKASAGAIYPALQQLEDEGLVTSDTAAGERTYSLTDAGKAELQREAEPVKKIWQRAQQAEDWGPWIGPEGAEVMRPAAEVMKRAPRGNSRLARCGQNFQNPRDSGAHEARDRGTGELVVEQRICYLGPWTERCAEPRPHL
jgi:DNA-binding PadR family transcriptional regulator